MQKEQGAVRAKGRRDKVLPISWINENMASWAWCKVYKVFISLRALSSSSLIALNFSFWVYSSSARRRAEREQVEEKCRIVQTMTGNQEGKKGREIRSEIKNQEIKYDKDLNKAKKQDWKEGLERSVPSKSSMVFSSLATVLSANSARVSAFKREKKKM